MPSVVGQPVTPIRERLLCDCGGEMKPTGERLLTAPPRYPHVCETCGAKTTMKAVYPLIKYE